MDLNLPGYVKLGGTAKKDSVIKGVNATQSFSEDSYDLPKGKWIGGPTDCKGCAEIEEGGI